MRRHILLPRLLRAQPLVTYIVRRQTLATALGLREVHSAPGNTPASPAVQPWWRLPADRLSRPARELLIGRSEEETPISRPEGERQESVRPVVSIAGQEALPESGVEREHAGEAQIDLEEAEEVEKALRSIELAQNVTDASSGPLAEPRSGETERASVQPASFQEKPEEPVRPGLSRRSARSVIAEISTGSEQLPLTSSTGASESGPGREQILPATENAPVERSPAESLAGAGQSSEPTAEELFAPRGTDRSPQAWLARLIRQAQRERRAALSHTTVPQVRQASVHVAESVAPESPGARMAEPISQNVRTFLKPLLGVDPAGVPVYRDRQAEQATASQRADALSDGEAIELAPGQREETPETLGLLAHELTHVARQQRPRFVPPVLRQTAPAPAWETRGEEVVALQVERQVRLIARGELAVSASAALSRPANGPAQSEAEEVAPHAERGIWGNLPAPWEPLPAWFASTPAPVTQDTGVQPAPSLLAGVASAPAFVAGEGGGAEESGKRRAGVERSVSVEESGSGENSSPQANQATFEPQRAPEPDLDALARQVYSLLRRRLSVEQRREM